MKKIFIGFVIFILWGCGETSLEKTPPPSPHNSSEKNLPDNVSIEITETGEKKVTMRPEIPDSDLEVEVPVLRDGVLPDRYTCRGDNVSPPFEVKNLPQGTQSLIFIMSSLTEEEAKTVHWVVWGIDPGRLSFPENTLPGEKQGTNSFDKIGYDGPCPQGEPLDLVFEVWALDKKIEGSSDWTAGHLMVYSMQNILGKNTLLGRVE